MQNKPIAKKKSSTKSNTLEILKDFGSSTVQNTADSLKNVGTGILDQFFGNVDDDHDDEDIEQFEEVKKNVETAKTPSRSKKEANIFNYNEYHESVLVKKEIGQLVEQIRQEIAYLKKADSSLLSEVKDIENISINSLPEKPGVYHIRFLEIVLRVLRHMREKIGESRTWMQTLISKKKKRGSLFAVRSKKAGTQYSMSQELSNSRSVQ